MYICQSVCVRTGCGSVIYLTLCPPLCPLRLCGENSPVDASTKAALAFQTLSDASRSLVNSINRYETRYDRQFNRALSRLVSLCTSASSASPR
jgi:hypothetical protein